MTVDATTPYLTVVDAQTYFDTRLNSDPWDEATTANKTKAIAMATRAIDRLNYIGLKAVTTQTNEFPRDSQTVPPEDVLQACCEEAMALLDGADPEYEIGQLGNTGVAYASVKDQYAASFVAENIRAGIMSQTAWHLLKPWLADVFSIALSRVS